MSGKGGVPTVRLAPRDEGFDVFVNDEWSGYGWDEETARGVADRALDRLFPPNRDWRARRASWAMIVEGGVPG